MVVFVLSILWIKVDKHHRRFNIRNEEMTSQLGHALTRIKSCSHRLRIVLLTL